MPKTVIPENAPFTPAQRAWLNGFLAGLLALEEGDTPTPPTAGSDAPEVFPWHDPSLSLDERLQHAQGRPLADMLMASMGQLDCGQCGYLCRTYAAALAEGQERDPGKCVPGGRATAKKVKELLGNRTPMAAASLPAVAVTPIKRGYHRERPLAAAVVRSVPLTSGPDKTIQDVVLSLAGGGLTYAPGDALGVYAQNAPDEVEQVLNILQATGEEAVTVADGRTLSARTALASACSLALSEELLQWLAAHASDKETAQRLQALAQDEALAAKEGLYDLLDVLLRFNCNCHGLDIAGMVATLPRLQPRLYSIASSLQAHPEEVHLTVALVRYEVNGRRRTGLASGYLAERVAPGVTVPIYIQPTQHFHLAPDETPIVMIGPGTGIAPFRAFLQERRARGARGRNWLFFGNPRSATDFLYASELSMYRRQGLLTRLDTAFSRDQAHKIYVQHRMEENAVLLWDWLQDGAVVYVCGDAKHMALDVDAALKRIIATHGRMSAEQAAAYVAQLAAQGRYCRDIY